MKKKHLNTLPVLNAYTLPPNHLHSNLQRRHLDGRNVSQLERNQLPFPAKNPCGFKRVSFFPGMKHNLLNFRARKTTLEIFFVVMPGG